jgi:hypothetical protein
MAMRRRRTVLIALMCAAGATAATVPVTAGAKKWRGPNIAGKYVGKTEYFGDVSFKLTKGGKILNFRLTNATMECQVVAPPGEPENPEYEKVVTITHGPMPMQKKSNKNPQGKKFEVHEPNGYYKGGIVPLSSQPDPSKPSRAVKGMGFNGETSFFADSGPPNVPGSELCGTNIIDWEAKPPGSKGFVNVGNSGHLRPPLSEFFGG